ANWTARGGELSPPPAPAIATREGAQAMVAWGPQLGGFVCWPGGIWASRPADGSPGEGSPLRRPAGRVAGGGFGWAGPPAGESELRGWLGRGPARLRGALGCFSVGGARARPPGP